MVQEERTGRDFTDRSGRPWHVSYTEAGVSGLVTMRQIVFWPLNGRSSREERYLTVHPGYLERADEHELQVALSQAQPVEPPW